MTETTSNVKAAIEEVASAPTDAKVPDPEGEGYPPLGQNEPTKEEKGTPKDVPTSGTKPQDITLNPFEDRPSVVHLEDEVSSISKEAQRIASIAKPHIKTGTRDQQPASSAEQAGPAIETVDSTASKKESTKKRTKRT
ncbi:hypothetical protein SAPIO_CDS10567 [Scedosporium apiospermum]|uniref:Uncharacterized protein n=1 Tax=Pseudallescheria apiosperma TaxID=563466 RepID=A0A084FU17_PSEDA|nr:uncharacterized protein SAPIO_CDS10567 [Scedosporium apiospermum]KEZ38579.1 hypothetical protein SAPIO_CDS10567 [Scedosporium apiospermum]